MDEICENFPANHYIAKVNLLRFFNHDENYYRLKRIFDNNLLSDMISSK